MAKCLPSRLLTAQFDSKMPETLLDLCALDWSLISPAIFGTLFQSSVDADALRHLGMHYTSEENILKLINPLFLDVFWENFKQLRAIISAYQSFTTSFAA